MKDKYKILLAVYGMAAIITFGHAFHYCMKYAEVNFKNDSPGASVYLAVIDSVVWPLYWSAQLWK